MIEICFGESLAGSLKYALVMKQGVNKGGACAVAGGTRKERAQALREAQKPWQGERIDAKPDDVFPLSLALDWGDLSDLPERRETLGALMGEFDGVVDSLLRSNAKTLRRLADAREGGEPVRVWFFPCDPNDLCALYFLCDFFRDAKTQLSIVELPVYEERDSVRIEYRGACDMPPERLGAAAKETRLLSSIERRTYAARWRELCGENAPLRAFVNGQVLSVPADFYDFVIRRCLPSGEFVLAQALGKALNNLPCVGDRPLYLRLKEMEARGEITLVSPAKKGETPYAAVYRSAL